jgi:hypothetical protein
VDSLPLTRLTELLHGSYQINAVDGTIRKLVLTVRVVSEAIASVKPELIKRKYVELWAGSIW